LTTGSTLHGWVASKSRPLASAALTATLVALTGWPGSAGRAVANGDTRSLSFFHTHTKEQATITFWRDGRYDEQGLKQLNWFLRDWRVNEPATMDPLLFNVLWEVYRESGSREPINIISAYRSPATNAMLRHRSKAVSEHSQHMLGKAMDIRLPDVDTGRLRAVAMRMQYGGVGYYPSSAFVHVDTGNVRAWPRMSQDQLARLFPDGKTVHLPSNGKPLARYEEAKAEVLTRKQVLASAGAGNPLSGLLASFFRGRTPSAADNDEPTAAPVATASLSTDTAVASSMQFAPLPPRRPLQMVASVGEAAAGVTATANVSEPATATAYEYPTPTSQLLFSGTPISAVQPKADPVLAHPSGPRALEREHLAGTATGPTVAQTFSPWFGDHAGERRFTGPAVKVLPVWRVAQGPT
jgi:uncharacterized protein YcbK (DUF882 family)